MKGKETFIKVIEDPVLYAEDHNLIIVLFDLKKMFVEYDSRSNYLSTLKEIIELNDNDNLKITNYDHLKFTKNGKF